MALFREIDSFCVHYRAITFLGHVPWLGATILTHPEWLPDYTKFRMFAQARAVRRIQEGSPYKDLFYHLVSYIILNLQMICFGGN